MTHDPYLDPVLELAKDDELMVLVKMILDRFSNFLETDESYKKNPDRPHTYIKALAKEFREMGGNSFANTWRGEGPAYSEIVCDVADEIGVKYSKDDRVDELFGMGIKGFIQKPMTIEKLSEAINFVIHSL